MQTRSDLKERKPLKGAIWLTDQIMREKFACNGEYNTWAKFRSLENFLTWQFASWSLRKQQGNGVNGNFKSWIVSLPEKKSRALLFYVISPSLLKKVCCVVLCVKCWHEVRRRFPVAFLVLFTWNVEFLQTFAFIFVGHYYSRLPITPDNSNLALTRTKIDFPWISVIHSL